MGLFSRKKKSKKEKPPKRPAKNILRDMGLCVLSGVLWFTACSDIDIWPFAWIAAFPMLWVIHDKTPRKAFWYSMLAGFVANYGGFYWISHTLTVYAGLPLVVGIFGTGLLAFYQALVYGIFGAVTVAILRRRPLGWTFVAPVVFVSAELIWPMEFPFYVAITQAWVRPVIQIADIAGPLGVTFMLIMFSGALFDLFLAWRRKQKLPVRRAAIAGGLMVFMVAYGLIQISRYEAKIDKAPKLKIGVIQANIGIRLKGRAQFRVQQLQLHYHLSRELEKLGADLIVWPESTHPYSLVRDKNKRTGLAFTRDEISLITRGGIDGLRKVFQPSAELDRAKLIKTPMLVGVQSNLRGKGHKVQGVTYPEKVFNSAILIDGGGDVTDMYDKQYLVTFSEHVPGYDLLTKISFLRKQFDQRHMSNFSPGHQSKSFELGKYTLGPMICFEDILPRLGRKIAATEPNVFINITNDAWFGATAEPYQHLALAVFRTIEHRIPMVRAVNTGTSTFIDATGRITVQTPSVRPAPQPKGMRFPTRAVRLAGLQKKGKGVWQSPAWPKPYILLESVAMMPHNTTIYAAFGWLFGWICLLVTLYLLIIHGRGLRQKAFRWRGEGMPMPDRKGRIVAPTPEEEKPKPKVKKTTPASDRKPRRSKGKSRRKKRKR